jgi:DNA-damage-inducible protein J
MANTTNINVRVDEDLKQRAELIFSELGMTLSTAMNLFLRSSVRYGGIPFDLRISTRLRSLDDMSEAEFNRKIEKAFSDAEAGKGRPAELFFLELERKYSL